MTWTGWMPLVDAMRAVPANRTVGLIVAGDDGHRHAAQRPLGIVEMVRTGLVAMGRGRHVRGGVLEGDTTLHGHRFLDGFCRPAHCRILFDHGHTGNVVRLAEGDI